MTMVTDDDNNRGEDSQGENLSFDLLVQLLLFDANRQIRERWCQDEQETNMFMINPIMAQVTKTLLAKPMIDHASENQQNPNDPHDYASSSSSLPPVDSKRRRVVSDEPIRAEPIREIKPPVRERNGPVRREPGVTPGWVVNLMREKKGGDVKMIIEKKLKASDLKKDQSRLLMPFNQMAEMDFLNEEELNIIEQDRIKTRKKGVDVMLVDSSGAEWKLNLRRWDMKTSSNYVLCSGWNSVFDHHNLEQDQTIRLWSFHSQDGNKLYFAFAPSIPAPDVAQPMAQPQPQPQDLAQPVAQSQAPYPDQAMAPAIPAASSSSMAPVVTRYSDELFLCVETNRRDYPFPKRRRTPRVWVPAPARDSDNLGQSILEGVDLNRKLPQVCTEMGPLEAVQDTSRRTSLASVTETAQVSVTETSLASVTETAQVSVTETTTLDLELRL